MQAKRNSTKSSQAIPSQANKKSSKENQKSMSKTKGKKTFEITASTLGSRSSMDSKLTKRRHQST